jgi:probable HAF family extracellular repeat protein
MKARIFKAFLVVLCLVSFSINRARAQDEITIIDMGTLVGGLESYPYDMNDLGQVVGESSDVPFLWDSKTGMQDLSQIIGGYYGQAFYINNQGQVVGQRNSNRAFLWSPADGYIELTSTSSNARGINNLGQVVGTFDVTLDGGVQQTHAFLWSKDKGLQDLGTLAGNRANSVASPEGINDNGQVVGWSDLPTDAVGSHAFRWTPETGMQDLGVYADPYNAELFINNNGEIAGSRYIDSSHTRGFVWTPQKGLIDLGTLSPLPDSESEAQGINDQGQVTGSSDTPSGYIHAFRWTPEKGMEDLGTLGGNISRASDNNSLGQIVGRSELPSGESHAFLWTEKDGMIDLGTLGGNSSAVEINDSGQIIGTSNPGEYPYLHATFWTVPIPLYVSGSVGVAGTGAVLQYTSNGPKSVTADGSGNYSLTVPRGWSGTVTPYKAGYSFTPSSRSYANVQGNQSGQNYTAQTCASCADVDITMGTTGLGDYSLPSGTAISNYYDGLAGGPVLVQSTNGMNIFASEHRNYQTSFSETLGFPNDQLTTRYWFTRYAYNANVKTWILVTNPDPNQDADVKVYIGDLTNAHDSFTIPAGTAVSRYYEGIAGGPVVVESTNGVKIFTSEHRNYQTSFSETLGFPDNQLTTKYWFTRYAYNANVKTWILVANTDPNQDADVKVYVGDLTNAVDSFTLPAKTAIALPPHQGLAGGPVVVESTNGVKILASEHRNYQTSFSETVGFPDDQLTTKYWFTRYAYNANVKTWILVANPDPNQNADVKVYIGDLTKATDTFTLPAGTAIALPPYEGIAGGPVVVESTNGVNIFASEHRNYQTSFSESLGFPDDQLTTKYWFTRYAYNANVKTWMLVTKP